MLFGYVNRFNDWKIIRVFKAGFKSSAIQQPKILNGTTFGYCRRTRHTLTADAMTLHTVLPDGISRLG